MQCVLKCRWISGEWFGRAQDKWWPGNWGGEGGGKRARERDRGKAGSDEEGLFPSKCAPKQSLSHTLSSRTHISLETSRSALLYLHTFPHPQPCFPSSSLSSSSSSPCSWRLWRSWNTKSMRCCSAIIKQHLKHVSNMHGEMCMCILKWDRLVGMWTCNPVTTYTATWDTAALRFCFLMCTEGASEGC